MADVRALRPDSLAAIIDIAMQRHGVTSGRALARKADDLGTPISYTTLNNLWNGTYRHKLKREHREALARLSGVRQKVIDDLAGARQLAPFALPERAAELTGEQRTAVLGVVSAFITANEALAQAEGATIEVPDAAIERNPGGTPPGQSEEPIT